MSAFGGLVLTNRGLMVQTKAQANKTLKFTRIAIGDGELSGSILEMNALVNQTLSVPISRLKVLEQGKAEVAGTLSNQSIFQGFYWREIGIFAQDPDTQEEVLYCYGNARTNADYIPAGGSADVIEKTISVTILVGSASNISAVINQSLIYETLEGSQEKADAAVVEAKKYTDEKVGNINFSTLATKEEVQTLSETVTMYKNETKEKLLQQAEELTALELAIESKQDAILNAINDTKTTVEKLSSTKRESTLVFVKGAGSISTPNSDTLLGILGRHADTGYVSRHSYAIPSGSSYVVDPFRLVSISNTTLGNTTYGTSVVVSRMYSDGIAVIVTKSKINSSQSYYYYSMYVVQFRGYNNKGLALYTILGVKHNYTNSSRSYDAYFQIFRKQNDVCVFHSEKFAGESYKAHKSYQFAFQFNIVNKTFEAVTINYNVTGLSTSSYFYYPDATLYSVNDINYGHVTFQIGTSSSYGKYKAVIKFDPVAKTITHTGKFESYSSATDTYNIPQKPSPYPTTKCTYDEASETITYATCENKYITYKFNASTTSYTNYPQSYPLSASVSTLKKGILEGQWYGYSVLKNSIAIYKLRSDSAAYVYVGEIPIGANPEDGVYPTHGLYHFGALVYCKVGTEVQETVFFDYTDDLKKLLAKAVG